jgi:riboflavin kinase/FMN adenylyltransferase
LAAKRIVRDPSELSGEPYPVIALGNFDGVHLGHQAILRTAREHAVEAGGRCFALTFDPAPAKVLFPSQAPALITTPEDKLDLLCQTGLDGVLVMNFTRELSMLAPVEFVRQHLVGKIGAREVVVGRTFTFGHDRAGDAEVMRKLGRQFDFGTTVVDSLVVDGVEVSSTKVREAIAAGDMRRVARMLGRAHFLSGVVVAGRGRGGKIGVPTANLASDTECVPSNGVYAARVVVEGSVFPAIANIGIRPTFGEAERAIEAHLLGYAGDLYGLRLRLELIERVRGERKFESAEDLTRQIARDIDYAKKVLAQG